MDEEIDAQYRSAIERFPDDCLLHLNYGYFLYGRSPTAAMQDFWKARPYDGVPFALYRR